jgi:WD40 repeat protein/serine/threonine protein kinase
VGDNQQLTTPLVTTVSYHSGTADASLDGPGSALAGDPPVEPVSHLEHRVLGDFALGEVIGQGGGGVVFRAEQRGLGRAAVVKVILPSLTARPEAAERFAREARLASRFDHPYAAHIYAFGVEHDGVLWIAMELVDGIPLGRLIRDAGPLALDRFVPLFDQLCEVVQSAHDQGIVHRDIKPSNIMVLARAGRLIPKLLDFGIAKRVGASEAAATAAQAEPGRSRSLTLDGQVLGSPMYMAPEQWRDATTAGPPADQYALGLVAHEVLTGGHAFPGPTIDELAQQHQHAELPELPAHLPAALHAVLARACDKRPERRFASLTELAAAIRIAALGAGDPAPDALPSDDATPYPGLAAYSSADRASFVGRERDVSELIDRLTAQPIVTLVGPSGSGKTSLLAAGLAPVLPAGWRAVVVRPGGDPLGVLAAIVRRGPASPYREAPHDPALPPAAITAGLLGLAEAEAGGEVGGRNGALVVIVDQAEELFTMCGDDAARDRFAEVLIAASASPRIRVALALRDDFLCRIEQLAAWRGRLGRAIHVLGPPGRDELERMLTAPARRLGFELDDPALAREIVDEVAGRPGALPLVAFTAARLWEHRDRQRRRLTRDAYQRIGGVIGALVQHADSVVDRMAAPDRRLVQRVFRRLITAEGARATIGRAELESALGGASAAAVIDRLLTARLIVSRDDDAGDRIEVIHETLAATWPRLAAWRRSDADGARLQEQLAAAARHWDERGRPADLLWRGEPLAELRRWQDGGERSVTPVEQAFARASAAAAARGRRARIAITASAFALLVAGIAGLVSANREIADQRASALARLRASFEDRGRGAIGDGDDARALLYLAEARRLGGHGAGLDLLIARSLASLDAGLEIVGHGGTGILAVEVGPDAIVALGSDFALTRWDRAGRSTRLADAAYYLAQAGDRLLAVSTRGDIVAIDASGAVRWRAPRAVDDPGARPAGIAGSAAGHLVVGFSRTATLWDLDTGRARGELAHERGATAAAIGPDGAQVATGDPAGVVRIWNVARREVIASCAPHAGAVRVLQFAPDGRSVVSGGNDGDVRICDAATGATLHRLVGHNHEVVTLDITADGRTILSAGRDGKPRIWNARTGELIRVLDGHRGTVLHVERSPDDRRILTIGVDGAARIWDREGEPLGSLQGHGGPVRAAHWDRDGRHVVTSSADGAIRRWDPDRAIRTAARQAYTDAIVDLAVSSDDRWILTAGGDRAILWDRRSLQPTVELRHDGKLIAAALSPDATRAVTTDDAGTARIWQLPGGAPIAQLGPGILAAIYAPDGRIVTASRGVVRWWTPTGAALGEIAVDVPAPQLTVDPSGRWLFVAGRASTILVVDLAAGAPAARLAIRETLVRGLATSDSRVAIADGASIRLWQLGTWAPLGTLTGHKNLVAGLWLLPDGRLVSAAADATLVWDRDGRLAGKLADPSMTYALAASPDGALLATTRPDGAILIWDAATSHLLVQLPAHRLPAMALQFSHDGTAVISGGNDGRLVTWDLSRRSYSPSELAEIVRCRVPLRLDGDVALPRDLEFDDPACRSLPPGR